MDAWKNSWHLGYVTYQLKVDCCHYFSVGLHSQKGAVHGFRFEFWQNDSRKIWVGVGRIQAAKEAAALVLGGRYLL